MREERTGAPTDTAATGAEIARQVEPSDASATSPRVRLGRRAPPPARRGRASRRGASGAAAVASRPASRSAAASRSGTSFASSVSDHDRDGTRRERNHPARRTHQRDRGVGDVVRDLRGGPGRRPRRRRGPPRRWPAREARAAASRRESGRPTLRSARGGCARSTRRSRTASSASRWAAISPAREDHVRAGEDGQDRGLARGKPIRDRPHRHRVRDDQPRESPLDAQQAEEHRGQRRGPLRVERGIDRVRGHHGAHPRADGLAKRRQLDRLQPRARMRHDRQVEVRVDRRYRRARGSVSRSRARRRPAWRGSPRRRAARRAPGPRRTSGCR